jgi:hypothetical protein
MPQVPSLEPPHHRYVFLSALDSAIPLAGHKCCGRHASNLHTAPRQPPLDVVPTVTTKPVASLPPPHPTFYSWLAPSTKKASISATTTVIPLFPTVISLFPPSAQVSEAHSG